MRAVSEARAVRRADLPALKAVIEATGLFAPELLDEMLDAYLALGDAQDRWVVVEHGDRPIGFAYSAPERMTEGTSNLLLIAVHPDHQGRGVGQALMRDAEASLAADGQRVLLVETSGLPEFERTRAFYRRLGYTQEARIRDYYAAGDDKIVFWNALRRPEGPSEAEIVD